MQTLKISLLVFFLSITISAQWHWQNPTPFGNGLSDLQFLTTSIGYACGSGGTLIKTTNSGENWFELESSTEDLIIDIYFLSDQVGWFLSYSDRKVYKTTNGGFDWEMISNLTPRYAHSLWFIDENKGFASGYQNLLYTTDGGVTWNEINNVNSTNEIFFLNSNIGFVGGFNTIYRTTNGGMDWVTLSIPAIEFTPSKIFALDQNKIFVVGSGYFQGNTYYSFLRTQNGGASWNGENFQYWLTDVYFKSISEGWICSDKIYKTIDQGNTWQPTDFSASNFVFFENNSWAISGWNTIIQSNDFWITANQQIKSVFSGFLWNGAAKDTNIIFTCGSNRTIVGSFDGGHSWDRYYESIGQSYLNAITFHNDEIWSVGAGGVIVKSSDNGSSWEESYINASWLSDIKFINEDIGFIVGSINGLACLYNTQDGGTSWELQQTFPEYSGIDGIEFSRETLGWMIANQDGLLKSTDLGRTWNVVYDSIPWFGDIAVYGDSAWFSYSNKILRTTDAGNSWDILNIFGYQGLAFWGFEIDFINSEIGYAGTYDSRIFKTTNGGLTWSEEEYPSAMPIQAIDFVDENIGWTFGDCGTILKRDPNYVSVEGETIYQATEYLLFQNYPNPFNPVTKIKYSIPQSPLLGGDGRGGLVTLKIYDILGREVATLVDEEKPAGEYEVEFSAKGGSASGGNAYNLPSGIYFYQLKAGDYSETKKMVLLR